MPLIMGILAQGAAAPAVAGAYDLLETQTLTGTAASVTFTGLGSYTAYKHLQIRLVARTDRTGVTGDAFDIQLNGDTGNNYAAHELIGNGTNVTSFAYTSDSKMLFQRLASANDSSDIFGVAVVDFLDAFSTSKNKTVRSLGGYGSQRIVLNSGFRNNTEAITSILVAPNVGTNFVAGSRFSLFGIR